MLKIVLSTFKRRFFEMKEFEISYRSVDYFDATSSPRLPRRVGNYRHEILRVQRSSSIYRAKGRSRRRIRGSNPLTTPRPYRRTPPSRTRSCLERENDPRPRSNSVDRVLGRQGSVGRNLKTRLMRYGGNLCLNK